MLVLIGASWARNALSQVHSDYLIAYVGSAALSEENAVAGEVS